MASPFGIALVACSLMAAPTTAAANDLIPSIAESAALRIGAGRVTGDDEATAVARALGHLRARAIPASDLQYLRSIKDLQGVIHVRFAQHSTDLPVLGGHIIVHLQNDGTIRSTDWYWRKAVHVTPIPAVTLHEAITAAAQPAFIVSPTRSELAILPGEADGGSPELVWRIISRRSTALDERETAVNAHTGRVIATAHVSANGYSDVRVKPMYTSRTEKWTGPTRMDAPESYYYTEYGCFGSGAKGESLFDPTKWHLCSPGYAVTDAKGKYTTSGALFKRKWPVTWGDFSLSGGDRATPAADLLFNAFVVHSFFRNVFGWEGYAGNNDKLTFVVHVGMEGAGWIPSCRCIQFGETLDGTSYGPVALDIVFHEWAHAINENTAGMVAQTGYPETSGAAEANSDIWAFLYNFEADEMGQLDKRGGWFGEMVYRENYAGGSWLGLNKAIRYLENPARDGISPSCYSTTNATTLPAHRASLPLSHAVYLLVKGGPSACSGTPIDPISYADARSIWWHALITYFGPGATMSDVRRGTIQAAADLFGTGSPQQNAVVAAFDSVAIP